MSQYSANRFPKKGDRVQVDSKHVAHGGKRGVVLRIDGDVSGTSANLAGFKSSGPWYTIRFDGIPGRRSHTGIVHGNYLIVEKAANVAVSLGRPPYRESLPEMEGFRHRHGD